MIDTPLTYSSGASLQARGELRVEASLEISASGILHLTTQGQAAAYFTGALKAANESRGLSLDSALNSSLACLELETGWLLRFGAYVDTLITQPWQVPIGVAATWPDTKVVKGYGCTLVPSIYPSRLELMPMRPGEMLMLTALGAATGQPLAPLPRGLERWTSQNADVVTIDDSGRITAIDAGATTIILTNVLSGETAQVTINVQGRPQGTFVCDPPEGPPGAAGMLCYTDRTKSTWEFRSGLVGSGNAYTYTQTNYWPATGRRAEFMVRVVDGQPVEMTTATYREDGLQQRTGRIQLVPGGTLRTAHNYSYHANNRLWVHEQFTCELTTSREFAGKQETITRDDYSLESHTVGSFPVEDCPTMASVYAINQVDYLNSPSYRHFRGIAP